MLAACQTALPVDIAVCAAAVADWRVANAGGQKLKKSGGAAPVLEFTENPDILAEISKAGMSRPRLVVGFAAETENLLEAAQEKLKRKGCDWILANDVSGGGVFGRDENHVYLVGCTDSPDDWGSLPKTAVAEKLVGRIAEKFCHTGR
jgi:phosphopantothenoylcysteine decarboxylase/phosphopantothenate--cysteine ligase